MSWETAPVLGDAQVVGWALLNSLWQVAVVAGVLAVLLRLVRHREPELRYGLASAALAVAVALPLMTGGRVLSEWREHQACWVLAEGGATYQALGEAGCLGHGVSKVVEAADAPPPVAMSAGHRQSPGMRLRYAAAERGRLLALPGGLWLVAVLALSGGTVLAWRRTRELRTREVRPAPARLHRLVSDLSVELSLRTPVELRTSPLVDVPTVLGWRRPVLLLPAGIADALAEPELRAVLAHELAHVRRNDYAANLVQTAADTLLFFNPAARWISARVREERECCCDAIAATAATGRVSVYMRALLGLEGFRSARRYHHAMALNHSCLLRRARRLAGTADHRLRSGLSGTGRAILAAGVLALLATADLSRGPADVGAWGIMTQDLRRRDARMTYDAGTDAQRRLVDVAPAASARATSSDAATSGRHRH